MNVMTRKQADWWRRYHRWGRLRFVTLYGALFFGSLTLALSLALLFAVNEAYFFVIIRSHLVWLASWCVFLGAFLGFLWYDFNEYRYRRSFPNGDGSGGL